MGCTRQTAPPLVHGPLKPEGPRTEMSASSTYPWLSSSILPTFPAVCVSLHDVCPFHPHSCAFFSRRPIKHPRRVYASTTKPTGMAAATDDGRSCDDNGAGCGPRQYSKTQQRRNSVLFLVAKDDSWQTASAKIVWLFFWCKSVR